MQELRLVAVSEDGSYAVLVAPGRSGRFALPIDERLRTVAKGQFSRLAQYDIEVESPLRPKEIQDRIRAGETAEEIADAAGLPVDRIRRFEGPVLAEREYRAQEAQRATVRGLGDTGPGPRLGDVVSQRLADFGSSAEDAEWDSRKRSDGNWQIQLSYLVGGRMQVAEWVYDPRSKHVIPDEDHAAELCLPESDWPARAAGRGQVTATVTPIGSRAGGQARYLGEGRRHPAEPARLGAAEPGRGQAEPPRPAAEPLRPAAEAFRPAVEPERPVAESFQPAAEYFHSIESFQPAAETIQPAAEARQLAEARHVAESPRTVAESPRTAAESPRPAAETVVAAERTAAPVGDRIGEPPESEFAAAGEVPARPAAGIGATPAADARVEPAPAADGSESPARQARKPAGRARRSSVPSWDEIMFGNSRQPD